MITKAVILSMAAALSSWSPLTTSQLGVPVQEEPKYLRHLVIEAGEGEEEDLARREASEEVSELEKMADRVALAFQLGDVDLLESCLVSTRIYISLKARGEEAGYKGRPQIKFMFARLFDERQTKKFLFDASSFELTRNGTGAVVHGDWTYVILDEDDVVTEHLRFELEQTPSGWRVFEIVGGSR